MRLKASYTVEAAVIISVSFLLFGAAVGISYQVFTESVNYVQTSDDFDAVKTFRIKEGVVSLYKALTDD